MLFNKGDKINNYTVAFQLKKVLMLKTIELRTKSVRLCS